MAMMWSSKATVSIVVMAMGVIYLLVSEGSAADCFVDEVGLLTQCQILYTPGDGKNQIPPSACCDVVKNTNITCFCQKLSDPFERSMKPDMRKVCYIAQNCDLRIPAGYECAGSQMESDCSMVKP